MPLWLKELKQFALLLQDLATGVCAGSTAVVVLHKHHMVWKDPAQTPYTDHQDLGQCLLISQTPAVLPPLLCLLERSTPDVPSPELPFLCMCP